MNADVVNGEETAKVQFSAKAVDIFSGVTAFLRTTDFSLLVENAANPSVAEEAKRVTEAMKQFSGKWVALENANEMPESAKKFLEKLFSLTTADVEKFFLENHFFVASGEPKVDGTKYTYNVSLDKEKALALFVQFVETASGEKMPDEAKETIKAEFAKITVAGTMTFDTKNALYSDMNVTVSREGETVAIKILSSRTTNEEVKFAIALVESEKEMGKFEVVILEKGKDYDFNGSVTMAAAGDTPTELAKFSGKTEKSKLKTLDVDVNSVPFATAKVTYIAGEKLTAVVNSLGKNLFNLEHLIEGDKHTGKVSAQDQEVANWTFDTKNSKLNALALKLKNVDSYYSDAENLLELNLAKVDGNDMTTGKVVAYMGDVEATADVSLQIEKEKFGLIVANATAKSGEEKLPAELKKFEFFSSYKEKSTDKVLVMPTDVVSREAFEKALGIENSSVIDYNYDSSESMSEEDMNALLGNPALENLSEEEMKVLEEAMNAQTEAIPAE